MDDTQKTAKVASRLDLLVSCKIFYKKLEHCTCDDNPYTNACDYCLAKRGIDGYLTDKQVKILGS